MVRFHLKGLAVVAVFAALVIIFARFFREGLWGLARQAVARRRAGAGATKGA